MFSKFDEISQKVLVRAKREMIDLKHPYVGTEHLVLAILKTNNEVSNKLKELNLTYDLFKKEIIKTVGVGSKKSEWFLYTPLLKRVIEGAILDSRENNESEVSVENLFSSLLEEGEGIAIRLFITMGIDIDELYKDFSKKLIKSTKTNKNKKLLLDEIGYDLTNEARCGRIDPVIGRDDEINRVIEILSRRCKNNPVLVGYAGVGKTAIVEGLASRIINNQVPQTLMNKRIYSLDMASTVAGTKYRGEFEERVRKILKEVENDKDIILFIDEVHTIVGAGGAEGAIDASNILKPALSRGKVRIIGATTQEEYKKTIEMDSALERRFQKVNVDVPDKTKVKNILTKLKPIYESFHGVIISDEIIDEITKYSSIYIHDRYEPDRSIDILDEVCASVSIKENKDYNKLIKYKNKLSKIIKEKNEFIINKDFEKALLKKEEEDSLNSKINDLEFTILSSTKQKKVENSDIINVISKKTNIPIYNLDTNNKKIFEDLEKYLKQNIIGQDKAINKLVDITKKLKLGLLDDDRPYSMLFVGPSGVGKTELVKNYVDYIYKDNFIRLDMSEYKLSTSINKIIGSDAGYVGYNNKTVLDIVKNKPYSVILLDEIEKACDEVLNLFLQILDEGFIKDSLGRKIYFNNTIIIMTSNIGFNKNDVGFNKVRGSIINNLKNILNIEFINRIDSIIEFNKISDRDIDKIIDKYIDKLESKYNKKGIDIKINKCIYEYIKKNSNYEELGARNIKKIIKDKIEKIIIDKILSGKKDVKIDNIIEHC